MTRFFAPRAWLGGAGVVTGLYGMATVQRWVVWVAVGFLTVDLALRFAGRSRPTP